MNYAVLSPHYDPAVNTWTLSRAGESLSLDTQLRRSK
jgi:hypothetical protein